MSLPPSVSAKLPDYDTAQAVQRLPGITVEIDQGEPRYVIIRGVDPNLNQVTIDGNLFGVREAEGRRVALDTPSLPISLPLLRWSSCYPRL